MQRNHSQLSLSSNISPHNYFCSPKMPHKDHALALRTLPSSFRRPLPPLLPHNQTLLAPHDLNQMTTKPTLQRSLLCLKKMDLLRGKSLHLTKYEGVDKSLNSCIHTRQTNPGYSRNALGGIYTK